jgi:hypothetical protein
LVVPAAPEVARSAAALHKLLFTLLREKYSRRRDAVDEFHAFRMKEGIERS